MRKVLSIVLVALMVSMMIPAMAFAEETATPVDYAELAAGETFNVTVSGLTSAKVTIAVNAQLFNIEGVEAVNSIASKEVDVVDGTATLAVNVNTGIPAVVESSAIKVVDGEVVSYQYASIKNIKVGDANGDGSITLADALQIAAKFNNKPVVAGYNDMAARAANGDTELTLADALQIAAYFNNKPVVNNDLNVAYIGEGFEGEVVDPFVGSDEPEVEETTLDAVTDLYAYYQNGTIYYAFEASKNADANTTYAITVGETVVNVTETTGSFAYAADYAEGLEVSVVASSTTENYVASAAATTAVIEADASGALATWLDQNGLTDVAITVHEIK